MNVVETVLRRAAGVFLAALASLFIAWFLLVVLSILGLPPFASEAGAGFIAAAVWVLLGDASRARGYSAMMATFGDVSPFRSVREQCRDRSTPS